jgi:hypothetical protein
MKNTSAWGWLAAGVLALGLNGIYQDGGADWARRSLNQATNEISLRTGGVLALATGRAEWFLARAERVEARQEAASCRLASVVTRLESRLTRSEARGFEVMSAQEEKQMERFHADREKLEAQMSAVRLTPASFSAGRLPVICPRLNVQGIEVSAPRVPRVHIPQIHVEVPGLGPA